LKASADAPTIPLKILKQGVGFYFDIGYDSENFLWLAGLAGFIQ